MTQQNNWSRKDSQKHLRKLPRGRSVNTKGKDQSKATVTIRKKDLQKLLDMVRKMREYVDRKTTHARTVGYFEPINMILDHLAFSPKLSARAVAALGGTHEGVLRDLFA